MPPKKQETMSNPYFQFKQFTIYHDQCAMKVGTDGTLLGAWTPVEAAHRILDIGTGSGLIALMLAQRSPSARITGIDIDEAAIRQARSNAAASPWGQRIEMVCKDICRLGARQGRYDVVVSNPPYFVERVACPDAARHAARHTDSLSFEQLLLVVDNLLTEDGTFSVVLPADACNEFLATALHHQLYLHHQTWVHTRPAKPAKRVLMTFVRHPVATQTDLLIIESEAGVYSPEFIRLLKDFYIRL